MFLPLKKVGLGFVGCKWIGSGVDTLYPDLEGRGWIRTRISSKPIRIRFQVRVFYEIGGTPFFLEISADKPVVFLSSGAQGRHETRIGTVSILEYKFGLSYLISLSFHIIFLIFFISQHKKKIIK